MAQVSLSIELRGVRRLRAALWVLIALARVRLVRGVWHTRIDCVRPLVFRCVLRRGPVPEGVEGVEVDMGQSPRRARGQAPAE